MVEGRGVRAELPAPVAGLLSDGAARRGARAQPRRASRPRRNLGCQLPSPFQTLSFLALSVIPSLKITDRGLVDVDRFELGLARGVRTLFTNAYVVVGDEAGTEHEGGWLLVEDGFVSASRRRERARTPTRPSTSAGALVTPGLVNTHHHLYQTLTRARAQEADLFTWLQTLYPGLGRNRRRVRVRGRAHGLAELALSGCTTVFDHHYLFPPGVEGLLEAEVQAARELGVRLVASRGSMDLGQSRGGLPPDHVVEDHRRRARRDREPPRSLHEDGPGARVQIVVAPCSPFSVTKRADARVGRARAPARPPPAHAPGGDGRGGRLLPRALRLPPGRVPRADGLARRGDVVRALRPPVRGRRGRVRAARASASPTARRRTSGSAPASRRCGSCSTQASASGSASTARRRTSAATCSSR